jgi:pimeloyl-ACP methyl ester carboxylesterase
MATFALIHGGFHTSRCWQVFATELTQRGHRALTVDLPVSDPQAGPDDYVAACVSAFHGADEPVIVVGHSIAGWTALRLDGRIPAAGFIFLASCITFPPGLYPNEPVPMILTDPAEWTPDERGLITLDAAVARAAFYHDVPAELADQAISWLVAQSAAGVAGPETRIAAPSAPSVYIRCADDRAVAAPWAEFASDQLTGASPRVIQSSHSPFLSHPAELADMFDQIVIDFGIGPATV